MEENPRVSGGDGVREEESEDDGCYLRKRNLGQFHLWNEIGLGYPDSETQKSEIPILFSDTSEWIW